MSQRDATNGYIATKCVCVSIIRTTTFENLKPLKNLFQNLLRIFEFQVKAVI